MRTREADVNASYGLNMTKKNLSVVLRELKIITLQLIVLRDLQIQITSPLFKLSMTMKLLSKHLLKLKYHQ